MACNILVDVLEWVDEKMSWYFKSNYFESSWKRYLTIIVLVLSAKYPAEDFMHIISLNPQNHQK